MGVPRERSVWLIFLLVSGPLLSVQANTSAKGKKYACDEGCPQETFPVCGKDGEWYQNKCIAFCADIEVDDKGTACRGTPMPFEDQKPGPQAAESNGLEAIRIVAKDVINAFRGEGLRYVGRIRLAKELSPRPAGNVPLNQPEPEQDEHGNWQVDAIRCTSSGDVYKGRMRIPQAIAVMEAAGPSPLAPWLKGQATGSGALYSSSSSSDKIVQESGSYLEQAAAADSRQQQQQKPEGFFGKLRGMLTGLFRPFGGSKTAGNSSSSSSSATGAMIAESGSLVQQQGPQEGSPAYDEQQKPQSSSSNSSSKDTSFEEDYALLQELLAAAEVTAEKVEGSSSNGSSSGSSSNSGGSANSTAAGADGKHRRLLEIIGQDNRFPCDRGYPYTAIGQIQVVDNTGLYICTGTLIRPDKVLTAAHCVWNTKRNAFYYNLNFAPGRYREGGSMVNPWGVVPWKSVTVFDAFKKNPATWDVAVVTLSKKLGSLTGYMGMAASCNSQVTLTVAGYPQDQSQGTCMANRCTVPYIDCNALTNIHTCDTIMGMSGSPLWDSKNRIRMIHVAGIQDKPENRGTTVTQFLVNTISKW